MELIANQQRIFDNIFTDIEHFKFHTSTDPLTRYIRDRRMDAAIDYLKTIYGETNLLNLKVLVTCGGVGGEAIHFKRRGFKTAINSDFSYESMKAAHALDPTTVSEYANAEDLPFDDNSYDIVVVQDGLHHLPRPCLGFTEMLRVAKKAVIVIEPKDSWVGSLIGTEYEKHEDVENYVFRWNKYTFSAITHSLLLRKVHKINFISMWDHNMTIRKIAELFPKSWHVPVAKLTYGILLPFNFCGNMMVGVVVKEK